MEFFIEAKPIIIVLHALAAAVGLGAVVTTDTLFFKFLKDFRISRKEADTLDTISKIIWTAILLLLITGVLLYLSAPHKPEFQNHYLPPNQYQPIHNHKYYQHIPNIEPTYHFPVNFEYARA
jgi:hypothetical protein